MPGPSSFRSDLLRTSIGQTSGEPSRQAARATGAFRFLHLIHRSPGVFQERPYQPSNAADMAAFRKPAATEEASSGVGSLLRLPLPPGTARSGTRFWFLRVSAVSRQEKSREEGQRRRVRKETGSLGNGKRDHRWVTRRPCSVNDGGPPPRAFDWFQSLSAGANSLTHRTLPSAGPSLAAVEEGGRGQSPSAGNRFARN
jgi:hypothetical protein